jgi:CRISPR/Cas system CMR-associated protein Cmr1 (group 7 of RAMP superfamily)
MINEDWEMESLKDLIYLQEEMQILKDEINQEKERIAAKILIINEDNKKSEEYEKHSISTVSPTT